MNHTFHVVQRVTQIRDMVVAIEADTPEIAKSRAIAGDFDWIEATDITSEWVPIVIDVEEVN